MGLWNTKRFVSMVGMITGFACIIRNGPLAITIFVIALQLGISVEIWSVGIDTKFESKLPSLKLLRWYIFAVAVCYIADGYFLMDIIQHSNYWILSLLFERHLLYSFILCTVGFIYFVLHLNGSAHPDDVQKTEILQYQYGQFAWNLTTALFMASIAPILRMTFHAIIWAILPMSTVVANDVFAYGFGKLFGRHKLTELSPKKTVEGYLFSAMATVPFGYLLAAWLMQYKSMLCPSNKLVLGLSSECVTDEIFMKQEYDIFGVYRLYMEPFQVCNLFISLWIAIVCPVGGFLASGYKRAFGMNNFGSLIPGHGGVLDRMDAEILMCSFVYCVYQILMMWQSESNHDEIVNELSLSSSKLTFDEIKLLIQVLENITAD